MEGIDLAGVVDSDFQGIQINFAPPRPAGFANFRGAGQDLLFCGAGRGNPFSAGLGRVGQGEHPWYMYRVHITIFRVIHPKTILCKEFLIFKWIFCMMCDVNLSLGMLQPWIECSMSGVRVYNCITGRSFAVWTPRYDLAFKQRHKIYVYFFKF